VRVRGESVGSHRVALVVAAMGVVLTSGLLVALGRGSVGAQSQDEDDIRSAIEAWVTVSGEACTAANYGNEASFQATAGALWSDATPEPTELANRLARFEEIYATPDATVRALSAIEVATGVVADPTNYPPEQATVIAGYVWPTPDWDPYGSPSDDKVARIGQCQGFYGTGQQVSDYGVNSISYESLVITGTVATAKTSVSLWTEYGLDSEDTYRNEGTMPWQFWLRKESGTWRLTHEYYQDDW
jgi:hypothetical protein